MDNTVKDEVIKLYEKGWSYEKIALELNLNEREVKEEVNEKQREKDKQLREEAKERAEAEEKKHNEELDKEIEAGFSAPVRKAGRL